MKYMHFNNSCSFAGVANMLELPGTFKRSEKELYEKTDEYVIVGTLTKCEPRKTDISNELKRSICNCSGTVFQGGKS